MISKFEDLSKLFEEINENIAEKVHYFVIGGATLLYHGLKPQTKDIDIVVNIFTEFKATENVLKKIGFSAKIPSVEYKKVAINQIFVRKDFRIDIFQKTICEGFVLSDSMQKRAHKIIEMKNITVSLCSLEDIFLLKTFTEREGDITDCIALAEKGIDWNTILEELKKQIVESKQDVWITWVGERLDILEDRGLDIPIMKEVNELIEQYFDDY